LRKIAILAPKETGACLALAFRDGLLWISKISDLGAPSRYIKKRVASEFSYNAKKEGEPAFIPKKKSCERVIV